MDNYRTLYLLSENSRTFSTFDIESLRLTDKEIKFSLINPIKIETSKSDPNIIGITCQSGLVEM